MKKLKLIPAVLSLILFLSCHEDPVLRTVVYQPGPDDGIDTYVSSSTRFQDQNFGDNDFIIASGWTDFLYDSPEKNSRILIDFKSLSDFSSSQIESVSLTLYSSDNSDLSGGGQSGSNASAIYVVTEKWQENTVTWDTQPAFSTEDSVLIPQNNSYDSILIDITDLTIKMLQYKHGFLFKQLDENPYSSMAFSSSDFPSKGKWPKITVVYYD